MKVWSLVLLVFVHLFQECECLIAEIQVTIEVISKVYSYSANAYVALESSDNVGDLIENNNAVKRFDKKLEQKFNEIISSLNGLKNMIDDLKFSIDINYFNTEVKHPTQHIFSSAKAFLDDPTNFTKNELLKKCYKHPPLDTLDAQNDLFEVLDDVLRDNWLINQAEHVKMESPDVTLLIKKLDQIVEILAISQAACSGIHSIEDAKLDFRKFTNISQSIFHQVERSKTHIHQNYIRYIEPFVKLYLLHNPKQEQDDYIYNGLIAIGLLKLLETKFNYGPFMTIGISQHNYFSKAPMTHYGNFRQNVHFTVNQNGSNIYFFLSPLGTAA